MMLPPLAADVSLYLRVPIQSWLTLCASEPQTVIANRIFTRFHTFSHAIDEHQCQIFQRRMTLVGFRQT